MDNRFLSICFALFFTLPFSFLIADENSQLYKILKKKEIVVSVGGDYEPYYIQNPKPGYPGFEVELAKAFADYLGVTLKEVVPLQNFADHARAIKSGRVDISFGKFSFANSRFDVLSFAPITKPERDLRSDKLRYVLFVTTCPSDSAGNIDLFTSAPGDVE